MITVNEWMQHQTWIEKIDILAERLWATNTTIVQIETRSKEDVVRKHQTEFVNMNLTTK